MDDRHNPAPSNFSTMEERHGTTAGLPINPALDDLGTTLVDVFTEYWPDHRETVVYRMSSGPWGRVTIKKDGEWTLVMVNGFAHSGKTPTEAILNYLEHQVTTRHPRARKGWNAEYEEARHIEMENVILKLGGTFSKEHGDFRACPPDLMRAAIAVTRHTSAVWWQASRTGMGQEYIEWVDRCIHLLKSRLETLENRWSVLPLPLN